MFFSKIGADCPFFIVVELRLNYQFIEEGGFIMLYVRETNIDEQLEENNFAVLAGSTDRKMFPRFHQHQGYELVYTQQGSPIYYVGKSQIEIKPGSILLIDSLYPHSYDTSVNNNFSRVVVHFKEQFVLTNEKMYKSIGHLFPWITKNEFRLLEVSDYNMNLVHGWLGNIKQEKNNYSDNITKLVISNLLILVLLEIVRSIGILKQTNYKQNRHKELVRKVMHIINDNIDQPPQLSKIAADCNVSVYYLSRLFKKEMGISFRQFVSRRRIQ